MRDAMPPRGVPVWSAFVRMVILLLAALVAGRAANAQTATPAFVQANESTPTASSSTATVPFAIMQSPGDLNVVIVGWHDSNVDVQSIVDSNGNVYSLAVGPTVFPGVATQSIYYAPNIAATIANTVTVTFTGPAAWADVRVAEYSGIDRVAPLDAAAAGQGSNGLSDSSTLTTSSPTSLLVAANIVQSLVTEVGSGFTQRGATAPATDILEDRVVTQQGTYNATAPVTPGVPWVMQLVAFRAASTVDGEPPTAPGTLSATPISVSRIDLAWVASTDNVGVTNYLIERCQDPGCVSFAQIASTGSTSYSDTSVSASTSYTYRVRATDAANNTSPYSNSATAMTPAPPDTQAPTAPTALSATAASGTSVNLSWTASTDNVGVTNYLIERCQGAGCTTFAQIGTSATTSFPDLGLTNATAYRYQVRATDAANNLSGYSNIATATTPDTQAPTAPTTLTATAASGTSINLSWAVSTDNVGVTNYLIERCQGAGCTTFAQIGTSATNTFSDLGAVNATTYRYQVRATDAANNLSSYSNIATATTPDTQAPTAPTTLTANAASGTSINLSWTGSTDNVAVTNYLIERCQGAGCTTFAQIGTSATTSFSDLTLINATTYRYQVRATDAANNLSGYSNIATAATPDTQPPSAPGSLGGTATSSTQISLTWTGSSDNVGVTGYRVSRNGTLLTTVTTLSYGDSGLTANTQYNYSVVAIDAAGNASAPATTSVTTLASTGQIVLASDNFNRANGALGAGWTVIDSNPVIVSQHVQETNAKDGNDSIAIRTDVTWPADQYSQVDVLAATQHSGAAAIVRAKNDPVIEMYFVYVTGPLGPGVRLTLAKFVTHIYTELWTSVLTVNAGDTLYLAVQGTTLTVKLNGNTLTTQTDGSITAPGFAGFDVTDYDGQGNAGDGQLDNWVGGTFSGSGTITAPSNVQSTAITSTEIDLSWTPSTATAGVAGYKVLRNGVQVGTPTTPAFADIGLTPSTSYTYTVSGVDNNGVTSAPSAPFTATTAAMVDSVPPSVPAGLASPTVTPTGVSLTWTASTDNVGVTGYKIFRNSSQVGTATTTSFSDSGLTPATSYTYTVSAVDAATNESAQSQPLTVTTASTPPPTGPVIAYSFNEGAGFTANDSSGNNHPGTLTNGPTWAAGHTGTAVNFDGVNDYVTAGNVTALNGLSAVTVSAWINGSVGSGSPNAIIVSKDAAFALIVQGHKAQFGIKSGGQWLGFPSSTSNVDAGGFHYVTGVFDGTTIRVYVDGVQQATQNIGTRILDSPSTSVQVASCAGGPNCANSGEMWKGLVDDVRIYNRALSAAEIVTDMNTPVQ